MRRSAHNAESEQSGIAQIDAAHLTQLSGVFAAPRWLRDIGIASWLLAGLAALVVGLVLLLAATSEIVLPVIVGLVVATVAVPVVSRLERRGVPRGLGAAIVMLGLLAVTAAIVLLVVGGITSQSDSIASSLSAANETIEDWLQDLGLSSSGASSTTESAETGASASVSTLVHGVVDALAGLTSLVFGLSFAVLATFFLLKDGPEIRRWVDRHLFGTPLPVAQMITGEVIRALRGYFAGVSLVAAFNATLVGLAAILLDVPLAGTIAVVTFVCAYVPYVGAVVAGAFAFLMALGAEGTTTALIMLVVVILANGMLQQIFQPIAFGATLDLNPLLVLIVTIGAGCLFGMVGLVLAAPLTSAIIRISARLTRARAAALAESEPGGEAPVEASPAPS